MDSFFHTSIFFFYFFQKNFTPIVHTRLRSQFFYGNDQIFCDSIHTLARSVKKNPAPPRGVVHDSCTVIRESGFMMRDAGSVVIIMTTRSDFALLPLCMKAMSFMKQTNKHMQNNTVNATATATETATVIFPPALMEQGVTLAKSTMKSQLKFALLWADAIAEDVDGVELIKACFVAAGYTARDARGTTTNASKFVAPARMVREKVMSEKAFFALKTAEAAAAFKEAGGMKGNGLEPAAWQAAREEIAKRNEAAAKVGGEARPPSGEEKAKPALSAFEVLSAAISLRKGELNVDEIDLLVAMLRS